METDSLLEKEVGRENREHEKVLSRFLDEAKWKATHTLHFAFAAMVWFSQGVLITVDSLSFSAIQRSFKLKDVELGYYNAALAVGILIGCMPTSLADSMGRMRTDWKPAPSKRRKTCAPSQRCPARSGGKRSTLKPKVK